MAVANSELEIIKPQTDKREYRRIVLPNALQVLLISDPETDKAAASMNVSVGSFSDPEGLAHFLGKGYMNADLISGVMYFVWRTAIKLDYCFVNWSHCYSCLSTSSSHYSISLCVLYVLMCRTMDIFLSFIVACDEMCLGDGDGWYHVVCHLCGSLSSFYSMEERLQARRRFVPSMLSKV
ncbi:insulin-degrading enzyme-like 1, peroxisomal, partial [Thalictrum thalictroides]